MAETVERVLRLLGLLQARRSWSGEELMERLGVSERTLRRDIDRLRGLGYGVVARRGLHGGYRLEGGSVVPPLLLNDDEAAAIAIGLLTAAGGTIEGIEDVSLSALTKLEQMLKPRIRAQVATLHQAVAARPQPWITVDASVLTVLAGATRDRERVRFGYRARDGQSRDRHVEPHRVLALYHRWYLLAFDLDESDWRTFRLDRITEPRSTRLGYRVRPIPGGDAVKFVAESMPARYTARVTLDVPVDYVRRRMPPGDNTVEAIDDGRCLLVMRGDSLDWMAISILWFGARFRVDEPDELVAHLRTTADRLAAALV
jgi:predicted DNA-binding transcriptional regulator YafY